MTNQIYYTKNSVTHLCEGAHLTPDKRNFLVWTLCGIDVPANQGYGTKNGAPEVTCDKCQKSQETDK